MALKNANGNHPIESLQAIMIHLSGIHRYGIMRINEMRCYLSIERMGA